MNVKINENAPEILFPESGIRLNFFINLILGSTANYSQHALENTCFSQRLHCFVISALANT